MMDEKPILEAIQITKNFYDPVELDILKGINLKIMPGKSLSIVGKSGEGKTTLLHILGSLDKPTDGELFLMGEKVQSKSADRLRNRFIGFIFQSFYLLSDSTALENVLMPLKILRKDTQKSSPAYKRACELLEMVGLGKRLHFHTSKLSGGEKQRVAIARALACKPAIIFADEPTGNLDHETAQEIQNLLLSLTKEQNTALLLVTHNLQLAKLTDECYELENGLLSKLR